MSTVFFRTIKMGGRDIEFTFEETFYGIDLWYHITFDNNPKIETIRMHRDKKGQWGIADTGVIKWIYCLEFYFNRIIKKDRNN